MIDPKELFASIRLKNEKTGEQKEILSEFEIKQIIDILAVKINKKYVFDSTYEIIDLLIQIGFKKTYQFLLEMKDEKDLFFHSPLLIKENMAMEVQNELLRNKTIPTKGGYKCKYCASARTIYSSLQTRSIDEPATQQIYCQDCERTYRIA